MANRYKSSHFMSLMLSKVAADAETKIMNLGSEMTVRLLLSTSTIAICQYYYSAPIQCLFYHPIRSAMLSQFMHCKQAVHCAPCDQDCTSPWLS